MDAKKQAIQHESETNRIWADLEKKYRENRRLFHAEFIAAAEILQNKDLRCAGMVLAAAYAKLASNMEMDETSQE